MICVICKNGQCRPGSATVVLEHGGCTVVFKDVPADVCANCGEYYLSESVSEDVLARVKAAARNGAEVEIIRYAA